MEGTMNLMFEEFIYNFNLVIINASSKIGKILKALVTLVRLLRQIGGF